MTNVSKQATPQRTLNPLGVAGFFEPSPFLDRLVRFLGTVAGTDKVFMFVQYYSKIIIWFLSRTGKKTAAEQITNLAIPISDFRILLRYYGLLPLIQWMIHIEHNPPATRFLHFIERIQNIANILYYPLEHTWWLGQHKVISLSDTKMNQIGIWSCRFWAVYVILQFLHLFEEWRLIKLRRIEVSKKLAATGSSSTSDSASREEVELEKQVLDTNAERIWRDTIINVGYFPLTVHWSLENSSFPDIGVGIFGTLAAIYQFKASWKAAG
ncbi:2284_t:CDS:2 [Ambispora gerdemannii]|uniref:2284_t:CDS:1 n=1 Tax=Ambispora gerdemannii TaxID=144530 RepID=A0A9N9FZ25_9GLOM|nr:2284_t:CDS:2 [Ambispora gerdemannii]